MFEDLGLKYVGPVDGHDIKAMESALRRARSFGGPGDRARRHHQGLRLPAGRDRPDRRLARDRDLRPRQRCSTAAARDWTAAFSDELVRIGAERADVVAITAAMLHPTGLAAFAERFPERTFDVGIAEQHALTSAAGMAMAGLHPVVAVYSTFLNRAFDQLLMDVALHEQPVTVVLDRAGVTGTDGASHNGMWDMSILSVVPGLRLAAPRDEATLREALREAVAVTDGPTVVRFPKGVPPVDIPALERRGPVDVLRRGERADVLLVAVGSMVPMCLAVAERAADHGIEVTVVDPRWVLPVSAELVDLAAGSPAGRHGGGRRPRRRRRHHADPGAAGPGVRRAGARGRAAAAVLRARQSRAGARRRRADRAGHRPPDRRVDGEARRPRREPRGRRRSTKPRVIAEIQVAPSPMGTADNPHAHVEAAIAVLQASGLRYEVGALGTTVEGDDDLVWATLRAAHEAMLAAGATAGISHIKVASVNRTMDSLTSKFR